MLLLDSEEPIDGVVIPLSDSCQRYHRLDVQFNSDSPEMKILQTSILKTSFFKFSVHYGKIILENESECGIDGEIAASSIGYLKMLV